MSAPIFNRQAAVATALITLVIFLVLIAFIQLTRYHGEKISGQILKDLISRKTNGVYQVDYKKIDISIWENDLIITDLLLAPTQSTEDSLKLKFEISVPKLELRLRSLFDVYSNKILSFESISIQDPKIQIQRLATDSIRNTFSLETGELYHIIDKYLVEFSIDSLDLHQASIAYTSKVYDPQLHFLFDHLDLQINNFLLDSISSKKIRLLGTENIFIKLTDQNFALADSIHSVHLDEIVVSTFKQSASVTNLSIKPNASLPAVNNTSNSYNILIPNLQFEGIDFAKAYLKNELTLESVTITQPIIHLTKASGFTGSFEDNRITKMFRSVFDLVRIRQLHLADAMISARFFLKDKEQHIESNHTSLIIEDFTIDSTNYLSDSPDQFFNHIQINALTHEFMLSDSSHLIAFDEFNCSSKDSILYVKNLQITPLNDHSEGFYDIRLPEIALEGLQVDALFSRNQIICKNLSTNGGQFKLRINPDKSKSSFDGLFQIEKIDSKDNSLELTGPFGSVISKNVQFKSHDFTLEIMDGKIASIKHYTELISIAETSIFSEKANIELGAARFTKDFRNLFLRQVSIDLPNQKTPATFEELKVFGFDPENLEQSHFIRFDSAFIKRPEIDLTIGKNQQQNPWMKNTSFEKLQFSNGNLHITDSTLFNISATNTSGLIKDFGFDTITSTYNLKVALNLDSLNLQNYEQASDLMVTNLRHEIENNDLSIAQLIYTTKSEETGFQAKGIKLFEFDILKALNEKQLKFDHGFWDSGVLNINDKTKKEENRLTKIPVQFEAFSAESFSFTINQPDLQISSPSSTFHFSDFQGSPIDPDFHISYCLDSLIFLQKSDSIHIKELEGDTKNRSHKLSDLHLQLDNNEFSIDSIAVAGFNHLDIIENDLLYLDKLSIYHPQFSINTSKDQKNLKIPLNLDISDFSILNAQLKINDFKINSINLTCNEISLAKDQTAFDLEDFQGLKIWGERLKIPLGESLFSGSIGKYQFNISDQSAVLNKVRLEPKYNRGEFQNHISVQQDWFDGIIQEISFKGLNFDSLLRSKHLIATQINIKELDLDTHRDKRLPPEPNLFKPLVQSSLRKIPNLFSIDTINIISGYVSHSEFSEKGERPGSIFFRNLNGSILNLTNDPDQIAKNAQTTFKAKGALMNTGDFMIMVKFDLKSDNDAFRFSGSLGKMDLTELNRYLQPTAYVLIRGGMCNSASFSFNGNNEYAMGEMKFLYDDLKISVLNQQTYDTKGLGASMKSFFANTFVVNTQNPHLFIERDGDIFHERNQEKSIFNFWGKALLSGVVSSIGATNNKKEIRKKNEEIRKSLDN